MIKKCSRILSITIMAILIIAGLVTGSATSYANSSKSPKPKETQITGVVVVERAQPFVLQGFNNQKAGGITIAEDDIGSLPRRDIWLRLIGAPGVSFADIPLALEISGNISVGTPSMVNGFIRIPIEPTGEDPSLTSLGITNIRYNVSPTATEGDVIVEVLSSDTTPTTTTEENLLGTVSNAVVTESVVTGFPDVAGRFFAAPAIDFLVENNIVDGYPDGTFRPQQNVTRAEFVKMVVAAREADPVIPDMPPFEDVPLDHWAVGFIHVAEQLDIVTGYPDGTFRPNQPITRAEIAAVIVRAGGFQPLDGEPPFPNVPMTHWAFEEITTSFNHGLIQGFPNGTFMPDEPATRAESSVMIFNWLTDR